MKTNHFFRIMFVVLGIITLNNIQLKSQNTFQKTYGNYGEGRQIIQTLNGNYATVGSMNGDVSLLVIDEFGNKILSKTYGGTAVEKGNGIVQTADGQYFYLIGTTFSFIVNGINAVYLLKVNATNGDLIWSKSLYGDGVYMNSSEGYSVELTENGGCIVSGKSTAFGISFAPVFVTKIDANGNILWSNLYDDPNDAQTSTNIRATSDGGYVICGNGANSATSRDLLLLKIDSDGLQEWA